MSNPNKPELTEPELISIIEGPPPQFELEGRESWMSYPDTPRPFELARCDTRTFNGPKMIARCRNAWSEQRPVMLEYKDMDGLKQRVEICGIRFDELDEGTLLQIWVRLPVEMHMISLMDNEDDEGAATADFDGDDD
ncbi:MAG: hypothetical protein HZB53_02045 [Chloroflexi bacterium]|nr:hypothetical protein [Chloroflexota bacterium]